MAQPDTATPPTPPLDPSTESPAALVARIAAGDPAAEGRLLLRFGRPIRLLLDRHTSGRPEAEDLCQDTFRLALEKLRRGELREPAKLPGFLAAMARSLAIEHYRKAARRKTEADSEALEAVFSPAPGQLGELEARENAALVRQVLGELQVERDRTILFRFYIAEEDKDSIAAEFGLDGLQFNRVLHRARQRYKELWMARSERGRDARPAIVIAGAILRLFVPLFYGMTRGLRS